MNEEIAILKAKVEYLEALCEAVMRILWDERGVYKGKSGRIEKELEPFWKDYLKKG